MRNAVSVQPASSLNQRKSITTIVLWIIQGLLALIFLFAGGMKLLLPIEVMMAQMTVPLPGLFLRFLGVAELAGALGMMLPGLLRIRPGLTWLAGACLVVVMIGAVTTTLMGGDVMGALPPLVIGLLCATVAYGRRSWSLA